MTQGMTTIECYGYCQKCCFYVEIKSKDNTILRCMSWGKVSNFDNESKPTMEGYAL